MRVDSCAYTLDANGNRTQLRKRDGQLVNYGYDALDRMILKDVPGTAQDVAYGCDLHNLFDVGSNAADY